MTAGGGSSDSDSKQEIDPTQKRYLEDLWRRGQRQLGRAGPGAFAGEARDLVGGMMPGLQETQQGFTDIAAGASPGMQFMQQAFSEGNPQLQSQIDYLGEDIGRNLSQNILPHLRSGGVAVGAPGGSRMQIAEGLAAEAAQDDFARGASTMRFNDLMRRTNAAQSFTQGQLAGGAGAMQGGSSLFNLGMAPLTSSWTPLQFQGGLLGNPTIIGESDSNDWNANFGWV